MQKTAPCTYVAAGDILSTNAEGVRNELTHLLGAVPDTGDLTIDLRASRLVDSVGLNLIVFIIKNSRSRGIRVRLLVAHPNLYRILTFTRLGQYAEIIQEPALG